MADNRPIWFSTFVLIVFCLGGLLGYRASHVPLGSFFARETPPPGPGSDGRFGGPGGPGSRRGGPGRGGGPPFLRGGPQGLPPEVANRLSSELQLDATQQDQLKKILADRRDRFDQLHREARERFDKEQRDLHAAIRAVLRQDQQARFDTFLERRR